MPSWLAIGLCTVYGCFGATRAELNSSNGDLSGLVVVVVMANKPKISIMPFKKKSAIPSWGNSLANNKNQSKKWRQGRWNQLRSEQ